MKKDKIKHIRPDFYISYWIFGWFFIYYFIIPLIPIKKSYKTKIYEVINPIISLFLLFICCLFCVIYIIFINVKILTFFKYLFITIFYKLLPIYCLRNYPLNIKYSILSFFLLFIIYNFYLYLNNVNIYFIYKKTISSFNCDNDNDKDKISYPFIFSLFGSFFLFIYLILFYFGIIKFKI